MPRNPEGSYDLPKIIDWLLTDHRDDSTCPDTSDGGPEGWLSLYRKERYLLARLQREREEEAAFPREEVYEEWASRVMELKAGLQNWKDRLPPLLAGKSAQEMRGILDSEVWLLLDSYARLGRYCPPVEDQS